MRKIQKILAITLLLIVFVSGCKGVAQSPVQKEPKTSVAEKENVEAKLPWELNLQNSSAVQGKDIVQSGDRLFYSSAEGKTGLYSGNKKICENNVFDIVVNENMLYGSEKLSSGGSGIVKMKLDGSEKVPLRSENRQCFSLTLYDGCLYWLENEYSGDYSFDDDVGGTVVRRLMKTDLSFNKIETVAEEVESYIVADEAVFYTSADSRSLFMLKNGAKTPIVEKTSEEITDFCTYGGTLFYGCNGKLNAVLLSESKTASLDIGREMHNFKIYDSKLWFICRHSDGAVYLTFCDNSGVKKVMPIGSDAEYAFLGEKVYFTSSDGGVFSFNITSSEKQTITASNVYGLTVYNDNCYLFVYADDCFKPYCIDKNGVLVAA